MGTNMSKGNTSNSTSFCFADLPDSIVADIISLLPIQSIVRCRSVCKAWLRVISGIDFNYIYQKRGKNDIYMTFIASTPSAYDLFEFNLKDGTLGSVEPAKPVRFSFWFSHIFSAMLYEFVGYCNGLLCLVNKSTKPPCFFIWNPVLAEYISIPEPRDTKNWMLSPPPYEYFAFGYCPLTKEYKILKAEKGSNNLEVLTFGPNTTSWRSVGKSCCSLLHPKFWYLNGVIHWICSCIDEYNSDWIRCFDCETEQQHSLRPPRDCFHIQGYGHVILKVLRNRLCLVYVFDGDIFVWVMEDYGVAESWTKESYHNQFRHHSHNPVPLLREDKIVLFFWVEWILLFCMLL